MWKPKVVKTAEASLRNGTRSTCLVIDICKEPMVSTRTSNHQTTSIKNNGRICLQSIDVYTETCGVASHAWCLSTRPSTTRFLPSSILPAKVSSQPLISKPLFTEYSGLVRKKKNEEATHRKRRHNKNCCGPDSSRRAHLDSHFGRQLAEYKQNLLTQALVDNLKEY